MKDLYSYHANQADLDHYYDRVILAYQNIFRRIGLEENTYLTYASGGSFSKYSHEFQVLTEAGEDIIYVCDNCKMAVNKEIIAEQNICPQCGRQDLREEKAVEAGNIFKLGTNYSDPFDLKFQDKDGEKKPVIMGCYCVGISRLMGAVVEVCHDEKGIIWPASIAPFKVHLLSLNENEAAEKIYQDLLKEGIDVLYDDRELQAGEKFVDADLIGCPYRVLVSQKTLAAGKLELKQRSNTESQLMTAKELIEKLR